MDRPYLTLVDSARDGDHDSEFIPLPMYPWDERPAHLALEVEECETAIHLAEGHLPKAAEFLKVPLFRLNRMVAHHPRLVRIQQESLTLLHHRAASEYVQALDSPNDRRREWGAAKILSTRAASNHPFAPAPAQPSAQASINVTAQEVIFHWRSAPEPATLDHANEGRSGPDDPDAA